MTSANFVDNSAANRSQNGKELKCIYKHGDAERNKTSPWILDRFAEFSGFFAFSCCTTRLLRCQPTTPPLLLIGSPFTASHAYATASTVPPPVYQLTIQPSITSIPPTDTLPTIRLLLWIVHYVMFKPLLILARNCYSAWFKVKAI